ncbi:MAG: hypothetical protein JOZ42_03220, partial [Acetobacteraceae bacterium]|nr:hypothetical protein [Acetobacteraceae bacterium]
MRRALFASVGAHAAVAALLVLHFVAVPDQAPALPQEPATVQMVLKAPGNGDAPAETGTGQQAERAAPPPAAPPPPAPEPPPAEDTASLPPPPPPAPEQPPLPAPPGPPAPATTA